MTALVDSTPSHINATVAAAAQAAPAFGRTDGATRAALLRGLATALEAAREQLVPLAEEETGLGATRLNGEIDRTAFQLRGFADLAERGEPFAHTDDAAVAGAPPAGRPRLTRVRVPLGPVAMFSASNFPFAFSVLGGDTAAALAAGCPVVVKAHPGHPRLSRAVIQLAQQAVVTQGLPAGVLGMVEGAGIEVGVRLVQQPDIAAVAFTGSFRGGRALEKVASERPRPIPFFGELGSINPVITQPALLVEQGEALAQTLASSIALGCGQFCTSPGVIVVQRDAASQAFVDALSKALAAQSPHRMLSPQIRAGFDHGVAAWSRHRKLKALVSEQAAEGAAPRPFLAEVQGADFIADAALHEEVFGPAALVVRVDGLAQAQDVLRAIGGSLTVTLWGFASDAAPGDEVQVLVRTATQMAGRVLFAGVPTGVAVTGAQQHGGPFPSSTAPSTTSVGYAALDRFLRPVALQDAPAWLLARQGVPV